MKRIKKTIGRIFDNPVIFTLIAIVAIYALKISGILTWWLMNPYLIWRGGW